MARNGINREQIFKVAKELALNDQLPTALKVRKKLATGSMATIQKYLQEWKKSCFINETSVSNPKDEFANEGLLEKYRVLEQSLNKKIVQNEHYVEQLIIAEKNNISLKEENYNLQTIVTETQKELQKITAINNDLQGWCQKLQTAIENNDNQIIKEQQKLINELKSELKTLNETYINALRETSTQGHEVLMQEKVNSINLQAKIDNLTKELLDSKKKAYEASMTAQVQNRSLSRQNEQLQKILQDKGLEQFLPAAEGSSLALTNGAAVDGK